MHCQDNDTRMGHGHDNVDRWVDRTDGSTHCQDDDNDDTRMGHGHDNVGRWVDRTDGRRHCQDDGNDDTRMGHGHDNDDDDQLMLKTWC